MENFEPGVSNSPMYSDHVPMLLASEKVEHASEGSILRLSAIGGYQGAHSFSTTTIVRPYIA